MNRPTHGAARSRGRHRLARQDGSLALEWVLTLPLLLVVGGGLLVLGAVLRDVLVLEEAARSAARTAAVTADDAIVGNVARDAAPELPHVRVAVHPSGRRSGQHVTVTVSAQVRYGPISRALRATSVALVEPVVDGDGDGPAGLPPHGFAPGPAGPTAPSGPRVPWGSPAP